MTKIKFSNMDECLKAFAKDYDIELYIIESFAGRSCSYEIPASQNYKKPWRLWVTHDEDRRPQVILDNIETDGHKVGLGFMCHSYDDIYNRLANALELAQKANVGSSLKHHLSLVDSFRSSEHLLDKFARENHLAYGASPQGHIQIPAREGSNKQWTIYLCDDNKIAMSQWGTQQPNEHDPNITMSPGFVSFPYTKQTLDGLLSYLVEVARISF